MDSNINRSFELSLLCLLALLWGSSYLFAKVALAEVPPLSLVAVRVSVAAVFLLIVMAAKQDRLPRDKHTWARLGLQSVFIGFGSWTILAWGQQFVDAGLASVLNSTSPIFVVLITAVITRHEHLGLRKIAGAILGLAGVALIIGFDVLSGLGQQVAGQLACLIAAALYGAAAINGKRFSHLSSTTTAAGTMIWSTAILIPAAFIFEDPLSLTPEPKAIFAMLMLSVFCTGVALLLYFRLVRTLGSLGAASQAYLRAGVGLCLGILVLGEQISLSSLVGLLAAIAGVMAINWPVNAHRGEA